jgi:hypothetical protein
LSPKQRTQTEEEAPEPLLQSQTSSRESHFTVLNDKNLQKAGLYWMSSPPWEIYLGYTSANPDCIENWIGENSLEYVALTVNFSCIELVKESHHNKRIKYNSEML